MLMQSQALTSDARETEIQQSEPVRQSRYVPSINQNRQAMIKRLFMFSLLAILTVIALLPVGVMLGLQKLKQLTRRARFPHAKLELLEQISQKYADRGDAKAYRAGVIDGYFMPIKTGITSDTKRWLYFCGARDGARLRAGSLELSQIPSHY
jgi:hypothetical protein